MRQLVRWLGNIAVERPRTVVAAFGCLTLAAVLTAAFGLERRTGRNDLVGQDKDYNQRYLDFLERFGDLEFCYLVIEVGEDAGRALEAADWVAAELETLKRRGGGAGEPLLETVHHRIWPSEMRFGLLFRELPAFRELVDGLESFAPRLAGIDRVDRLTAFFDFITSSFSEEALAALSTGAGGESGAGSDAAGLAFRVLDLTLRGALESLEGAETPGPRRALEDSFGLPIRERGYLATGSAASGGELLLIEIEPTKDRGSIELIRAPLLAMREVLARARDRYPGLRMGLTGRPVLQADEMMTTEQDVRFATIIALVGVFFLFALFFRRLRRPFLAVLTLAFAIAITFGVVTVTIGYVTLLSIVFAAMLVGLGIDFGIHFIARYQEELWAGDPDMPLATALRAALASSGVSIATGGLTTAVAFYTICIVDFQGLRELGFIAGTGVLVCLLCMLLLLPALLVLLDKRRKPGMPRGLLCLPVLAGVQGGGRPVILGAVIVALGGAFFFRGIPYDQNLIELQARELESVRYEKLLFERSDISTWYCTFLTDDLTELRRVREALGPLRERDVVGHAECVLDYLPAEAEAKLALLEGLESELPAFAPRPRRGVAEVELATLADSLDGLVDRLDGIASLAVQGERAAEAARLDDLSGRAESLLEATEALGAAPARDSTAGLARLGRFQERWFSELQAMLSEFREALRPRPFTAADLPEFLRRRLVGQRGERFALYAYPQKDIWETEAMEEFIAGLREVDPEVTGTPVQVYESTSRMRRGFFEATVYSLIATLVLLLLDLRSVRAALLAMTPLLLGLLFLLELLPLLGLEFNLANFFALPILIGCGIDGGVHIVHRFRESQAAGERIEGYCEGLRTTCSAVSLSFLTTMMGFGAMCFATHRGIRSLGLLMVVGLVSLLLSSVVVLPSLLGLIRRPSRPSPPST